VKDLEAELVREPAGDERAVTRLRIPFQAEERGCPVGGELVYERGQRLQ